MGSGGGRACEVTAPPLRERRPFPRPGAASGAISTRVPARPPWPCSGPEWRLRCAPGRAPPDGPFASWPGAGLRVLRSPLLPFLPRPLQALRHRLQGLDRNFSRIAFLSNYCFCSRLRRKFLGANIEYTGHSNSSTTIALK